MCVTKSLMDVLQRCLYCVPSPPSDRPIPGLGVVYKKDKSCSGPTSSHELRAVPVVSGSPVLGAVVPVPSCIRCNLDGLLLLGVVFAGDWLLWHEVREFLAYSGGDLFFICRLFMSCRGKFLLCVLCLRVFQGAFLVRSLGELLGTFLRSFLLLAAPFGLYFIIIYLLLLHHCSAMFVLFTVLRSLGLLWFNLHISLHDVILYVVKFGYLNSMYSLFKFIWDHSRNATTFTPSCEAH